MPSPQRPLSPFMIGPYYRPQLTSMLSFLHRITGIVLAGAGVTVVAGVMSVAYGPESYALFVDWMSGLLGKVLGIAFLFSLCFHFFNGIRHLAWDSGWGLDLPRTYATGWMALALSVLTTAAISWLLFSGPLAEAA